MTQTNNYMPGFAIIEKMHDGSMQSAVMNILEDFTMERIAAEQTQQAVLNIMDDFTSAKNISESNQNALLNILEDFSEEKRVSEGNQKAVLNILEDFTAERIITELTQKAVLNILEDFNVEKSKVSKANEELVSANKELESFCYSISHDLRNPLRAINGFAEMISIRYGERIDDDGKRLLKVVIDSSYKMGKLINDLLAFARLGRAALIKTPINMQVLVANIWSDLQKTEPNRARLNLGKLHTIHADKILIQQALINLLANAVKYSSNSPEPTVLVHSVANAHEIIYSVTDNGVGFDMEYCDKLFGVFQRLHEEEEFEGNGVGLAIVQRVISKHGGRVWATSELNKGASFYFSLPVFINLK